MKRPPIVIGLTGGVGSGKSAVTEILKREHGAVIIIADLVSHELMQPGCETYQKVADLLPKEAFDEKGLIGDGRHERFIVTDDRFMKKCTDKRKNGTEPDEEEE